MIVSYRRLQYRSRPIVPKIRDYAIHIGLTLEFPVFGDGFHVASRSGSSLTWYFHFRPFKTHHPRVRIIFQWRSNGQPDYGAERASNQSNRLRQF